MLLSFNPFRNASQLSCFSKTQFFFWWFQCLTGYCLFDIDSFKPAVVYGTHYDDAKAKQDYSRYSPDSPENLFGLFDYLLIVPFLLKLTVIALLELWLYLFLRDSLLCKILSFILFFPPYMALAAPHIFFVCFKYFIASLITVITFPVLWATHAFIKYQSKELHSMPILSTPGLNSAIRQSMLYNRFLMALLYDPDKQEVPFCEMHPVNKPYSIRPIYLVNHDSYLEPITPDERPMKLGTMILGFYDMTGKLCSLVIPNETTKKGIMFIKNNNLFNFSNANINNKLLEEQFLKPHWGQLRVKVVRNAALQVISANCNRVAPDKTRDLGPISNPDELTKMIAKFADLGPVSQGTLDDHCTLMTGFQDRFFHAPGESQEWPTESKIIETTLTISEPG